MMIRLLNLLDDENSNKSQKPHSFKRSNMQIPNNILLA